MSQTSLEPSSWTGAVRVPVDGDHLEGELAMPSHPRGVVVFAHGSGSSRHSPRNRFVAGALQARGLATLLIDLLTETEGDIDERTAQPRFDIPLLSSRLVAIVDWLEQQPALAPLPVGLFGASTGAGAALVAAGLRPRRLAAVVSRGGRPDLAGPALSSVRAPTLLIVGSQDEEVIVLNQAALHRMPAPAVLSIVPGATHLFEEPGALDRVAELAGDWLIRHLHLGVGRG
jgi:putative phosphoribosyl transferase